MTRLVSLGNFEFPLSLPFRSDWSRRVKKKPRRFCTRAKRVVNYVFFQKFLFSTDFFNIILYTAGEGFKKMYIWLDSRVMNYREIHTLLPVFAEGATATTIMSDIRTGVHDGHNVRWPFGPAVGITSSEASHVRRAGFQCRFSRLAVGPLVVVEYVPYRVPGLVARAIHGRRVDYLRRRLYVRPHVRRVLRAK